MPAVAERESPLPEVRNLRFPIDERIPRYWHGGRRAVTLYFNSLSVFFPPGESFFIRSIQSFQHRIVGPHLREQVRAFCQQEGIHTREHVRYNRMLRAQGLPVERLEQRVDRLLRLVERVVPRRWCLSATAALEHFTAVMGHFLLAEPGYLDGADATMAAIWRWHAAEEYEHKAVAHDVYQLAGGSYPERVGIMVVTTAIFWCKVIEQQAAFMRADGILWSASEWKDLLHFLFVEPGGLRLLAARYLDYFRPGFHPRDLEDREPFLRWREALQQEPIYAGAR